MMKLKTYMSGAAVALGLCFGATTALAQNSYFNQGDLLLAFQNPGGAVGADQIVLVSLGNAADLYRDGNQGSLPIVNIGDILSSTFGADWAEQGTLYMGALSAWSNGGSFDKNLLNGDPVSTVYVSAGRMAPGTEGSASSVGWSGIGATALQGAATRMLQIAGNFNNGGDAVALTLSVGTTAYAGNNAILNGIQQTAYQTFAGGTQFQFGLGGFGTFGGIEAEGALDLYRLQAYNNRTGQYGEGGANGTSSFLGSLVIDGAGNVSYVNPIPEPGAVVFLGVAGVAFLLYRRRQIAPAVN